MFKVGNYIMEKMIDMGYFGAVLLTTKEGDNKKYATKVFNRDEVDSKSHLKKIFSK